MPALPLQLRLEPHHVAAIDAVCLVTDPQSGLTVTLSRQQVILGIIDQWMAARPSPAPDRPVPPSPPVLQPERPVGDIAPPSPAVLPDPSPPGSMYPVPATDPSPPDALPDRLQGKAALAARVRALRETRSFAQIAAQLQSEGLPTPGGTAGAKWSKSMIARLEKFGV